MPGWRNRYGSAKLSSERRQLRNSQLAQETGALTGDVTRLQNALKACIAAAGNPDAAEGCRLVIEVALDAL